MSELAKNVVVNQRLLYFYGMETVVLAEIKGLTQGSPEYKSILDSANKRLRELEKEMKKLADTEAG